MKAHRFWTLLIVAGLSACISDNPTGVAHVETIDGVVINRVDDLGMFKLQRLLVADEELVCEVIDFEEFTGNSLNPGPFSVLGVTVNLSIDSWNDPGDAHDCGTGDVLIFDTDVASSLDQDLVDAGQSVTPNLHNVASHQSCETDGVGEAFEPNDADVETFMKFAFTPGSYFVTSFSALDQEGTSQNEFIALNIDVGTDGSQVGITDITVDNGNMVEVVDVDPDAAFSTSLDFHFDGSGAIDDIEVCKIIVRGGEGCTPGFWKQPQHFDSWPVSTATLFGDAFAGFCGTMSANLRKPENTSTDICGITLLEALSLKGGGINALGRHAAAAWLNSGSTVDFHFLQSEVATMVEAALLSGTYEPTKDALAEANEAGCPLS